MSRFGDELAGPVGGARDAGVSTEPLKLAPADAGPPDAGTPDAGPEKLASPQVKTSPATRQRWDQLLAGIVTHPPATDDFAGRTITRLLQTRSGGQLVDDLHAAFHRKGRQFGRIRLDFRSPNDVPDDELLENGEDSLEAETRSRGGKYWPMPRYQSLYTVYVGVETYKPHPGESGDYLSGYFRRVRSGPIKTVESLYHELLHLWFIHTHTDTARFRSDDIPFPGHSGMDGNTYREMHPDFSARLHPMHDELEALEAYLLSKSKPATSR